MFRLGKWDPDKVLLDDFYASAYIFLEMIAREVKTQIAGVTVVNDVSGFGFRLFGVLFNMIKPFLPDKVKDNIVFHG